MSILLKETHKYSIVILYVIEESINILTEMWLLANLYRIIQTCYEFAKFTIDKIYGFFFRLL